MINDNRLDMIDNAARVLALSNDYLNKIIKSIYILQLVYKIIYIFSLPMKKERTKRITFFFNIASSIIVIETYINHECIVGAIIRRCHLELVDITRHDA